MLYQILLRCEGLITFSRHSVSNQVVVIMDVKASVNFLFCQMALVVVLLKMELILKLNMLAMVFTNLANISCKIPMALLFVS